MDKAFYLDKVRGGWFGKCLAGAIGMPFEGVPYTVKLSEQDIHLSDVPNDDLELQIVWMDMMRTYGLGLRREDVAAIWMNKIRHGCDEYSIALHNMKHGILPPASGWYNNFFCDGMGSTIRSEIWALLFCERPDAAAHFAQLDSEADHYGDGVRGEVFMAEAEAHACVHSDIEAALRYAFDKVDPESRLHRSLAVVFDLYDRGVSDEDARAQLLLTEQRIPNFTDCVMNLTFIVHSLLRGKGDFIKTVLDVVSFGRDTDCTAATCGAFLGIAGGMNAFPACWHNAVKNTLFLSDFVKEIPGVPLTLEALVAQTAQLHDKLSAELPTEPYAPYTPYVPQQPMPAVDSADWLVLHEGEADFAALEKELAETGKCPDALKDHIVHFDSLFLDLSAFARNAEMLHLYSFLTVNEQETPPEETVLSATADVGMRLFVDGKRLMNHHSRQKMLPSFHRAEGGAAFTLPLAKGSRHLFHLELFYCLPPMKACLMFGNLRNDHLDGFDFRI